MTQIINQDITTVAEGIVAHGVNCQGVMNSGVAKAIRNQWPEVFKRYQVITPDNELLGSTQIVRINDSLFVANCFTQQYYGSDGAMYADLTAIHHTLNDVFKHAAICSVHVGDPFPVYLPQIGCGLGGLSWDRDVNPIVEQLQQEYPSVTVYVCVL